jgi:hypothetical protein
VKTRAVPVPTDGNVPSKTAVARLYDHAIERIDGNPTATGHPRCREVRSLLDAARRYLSDPSRAREEAKHMLRRGLRPETRKMVCPIDTVALREYVDTAGPEADEVPRHKDGRSYGKTLRDLASVASL